jgi:hypothetical protein
MRQTGPLGETPGLLTKLDFFRIRREHQLMRQNAAVQWRHEVQPLVKQGLSIGSSEHVQEPIQWFASQKKGVTRKPGPDLHGDVVELLLRVLRHQVEIDSSITSTVKPEREWAAAQKQSVLRRGGDGSKPCKRNVIRDDSAHFPITEHSLLLMVLELLESVLRCKHTQGAGRRNTRVDSSERDCEPFVGLRHQLLHRSRRCPYDPARTAGVSAALAPARHRAESRGLQYAPDCFATFLAARSAWSAAKQPPVRCIFRHAPNVAVSLRTSCRTAAILALRPANATFIRRVVQGRSANSSPPTDSLPLLARPARSQPVP